MRELKLFVSAGEASGDALLASALQALRRRLAPETRLILQGLGGPQSKAQGLRSLAPLQRLAVNGLGDVLSDLPFLWCTLRRSQAAMRDFEPDAVLLVDYPGMNLPLLRLARERQWPVLYWAPPQLWSRKPSARRERRMRELFAGVSVQVLFPFEAAAYQAFGSQVTQGHLFSFPSEARSVQGECLLLCPGSRLAVLRRNLPAWLQGIAEARKQAGVGLASGQGFGSWHSLPLLALIPEGLHREEAQALIARSGCECDITSDKAEALRRARGALCFPGTMTLEIALAGLPMAVLGLLDTWTWWAGRKVVATPWLALPNILLQASHWPEWVGPLRDFHPGILAKLGQDLESQNAQKHELLPVLGQGQGGDTAAESLLSLISQGRNSRIAPPAIRIKL